MKYKFFTLIELLVVMAVVAMLISLLQPSLEKIRLRSESLKCQSNLHQIGVAYQYYVDEYDGWLPLLGRNRVNWELAPYLGISVPDSYHQGDIVYEPSENSVWECLSTKYDENDLNEPPLFGGYAVNYDYLGYLIDHGNTNRRRQHSSTVSKPASTLVLGDGADDATIWWHLRYYMLSSSQASYKYDRHLGKMNTLWLDGHVSHQYWDTIMGGKNNDRRYYFRKDK